MNDFRCVLIHNKRTKLGWSMESLCKGICSVSYLSKLEKGNIEIKEDIIDALLKKLDINLEKDLDNIINKVDDFYNNFVLFSIGDTSLNKDEIDKLLNSKYCLDGIIINAYQYDKDVDKLKDYENFYNFRQKKKYYQILVHKDFFDYHELLHLFPEIDSYSIIANSLYEKGEYAKSIPFFIQYYEASCKTCDIDNMIHALFGLGSVYACLFDIKTCIEKYNECLKLIDKVNGSSLKDYIYYNIGATYVELKDYDKAINYLSKSNIKGFFYYQKMALCYENSDIDKANEYLNKAYMCNSKYAYLLDVIKYRITNSNYIHDEEYETLLKGNITKVKKDLIAGFLPMQQNDLLKYYEENRRYKDAYKLLKEITYSNRQF